MKTVVINNILWTIHNTPKGVWVYMGNPRENWENEDGWLFKTEAEALSAMSMWESPRVQFNILNKE
jgi:hypothetical protein